MIQQLRMDAAIAGAEVLAEKIDPILTRAERRSYREFVVRVLMALLESYDQQVQREEAVRCEPSAN
jgi:hypothetical protein